MVVPNTTLGKTKEAFIDATCPMIWLILTKVYIPHCSHVFWRTFSKGDAFIGYHDDIVPAVVLQVCAELHSDGVFLSDEERKSWEEKVSRQPEKGIVTGIKRTSYLFLMWSLHELRYLRYIHLEISTIQLNWNWRCPKVISWNVGPSLRLLSTK